MATAVKQFQIDIATNPSVIIQTAEPVASNVPSPIPVSSIIAITPIFYDYRPASGPLSAAISSYANSPNEIVIPGVFTSAQIMAGDIINVSGSVATPVLTAVTGYTTGPNSIKFTGVYTDFITPGMQFTIAGSTDNDGVYTAISVTDDGVSTTVVVAEIINPAVTDGSVAFTPVDNNGSFTVVSVADNGIDTTITVIETVNPGVTGGSALFTPHYGVENNETGAQFAETYPYPTMTRLRFTLHDGQNHDIELQSITNQATWSTGTLAALQTAAAAFNALL
jgi:hypothetical protein